MELGTFEPRSTVQGDRLQAKEAVDKPLVVLVREHRTGIVTQYNPPPGGEGVVVDVAEIATNQVFIDVLWMNGAVVDNLSPYVGNPVAIKLQWIPSAKGGNPYIGVRALEGDEMAAAGKWVAANQTRFDNERVQRAAAAGQQDTAPPADAAPAAPAAPPPPAPAAAAPAVPAAVLDPNDPAVRALLEQINNGQAPPPAG